MAPDRKTLIIVLAAFLLLYGPGVLRGAEEPHPEAKKPLEWVKPRFEEQAKVRSEMVRTQIASRGVTDPKVFDAMRAVPRHLFVPEASRSTAYADNPLPIGEGQTISQPYVVAYMTELLKVTPGDKVLEVGTGSGYQAAVLSELTPNVFTIEVLQKLGEQAKGRLKRLGYETVEAKIADGFYGWEEKGPFDEIIVTAAASYIPPPLVKQLKEGGRLVIPVGGSFATQRIVLVEKEKVGTLKVTNLIPVIFVPLLGEHSQDKSADEPAKVPGK